MSKAITLNKFAGGAWVLYNKLYRIKETYRGKNQLIFDDATLSSIIMFYESFHSMSHLMNPRYDRYESETLLKVLSALEELLVKSWNQIDFLRKLFRKKGISTNNIQSMDISHLLMLDFCIDDLPDSLRDEFETKLNSELLAFGNRLIKSESENPDFINNLPLERISTFRLMKLHIFILDMIVTISRLIAGIEDSQRNNTFSSVFAYNLSACRAIPIPVKLCADVFEQIKDKFIDNTNELSFCNFLNTEFPTKKDRFTIISRKALIVAYIIHELAYVIKDQKQRISWRENTQKNAGINLRTAKNVSLIKRRKTSGEKMLLDTEIEALDNVDRLIEEYREDRC